MIKASKIKTSNVLKLACDNVSSHAFSYFFLISDVFFLISAVITQFFDPTAELAIPIGIQTNEANVEIQTTTGSR